MRVRGRELPVPLDWKGAGLGARCVCQATDGDRRKIPLIGIPGQIQHVAGAILRQQAAVWI